MRPVKRRINFWQKPFAQSLQFSIHILGLLFVDLVLAWLSHVFHPTKERHALLWTIGLTLGVILGGNCGLGDFGHSVGFGNFSPVRGRNSSAPLSRLPCHLNAAYPHPLSKCQSQSATDCALVHCKLPTCSYMLHTILPPKVPKSPELLTIAGHFNLPWLKNKRVATFTSSVGIAINICSDFNVGDCVCLKVQNFSYNRLLCKVIWWNLDIYCILNEVLLWI